MSTHQATAAPSSSVEHRHDGQHLLLIPGFHDVALRDFGLLLAALALARLASGRTATSAGSAR